MYVCLYFVLVPCYTEPTVEQSLGLLCLAVVFSALLYCLMG